MGIDLEAAMMTQSEKTAILQLLAEEILKAFNKAAHDPHQSADLIFEVAVQTLFRLGFFVQEDDENNGAAGFIVSFFDDDTSYEVWEVDENCSITDHERYGIVVVDQD